MGLTRLVPTPLMLKSLPLVVYCVLFTGSILCALHLARKRALTALVDKDSFSTVCEGTMPALFTSV